VLFRSPDDSANHSRTFAPRNVFATHLCAESFLKNLLTPFGTDPTTPTAAIAPGPQRQVSDVLMDAGLSRWLLALGNSDVPPRANVPPLRDHERQSRNQHLATSNALPLRAVEHAFPVPTSAPQPARQAPLNPGLSRRLLPLAPHRTPHRFATTNARLETKALSNSNVPGAATFGRSHDAVVAPASPSPHRLARLLQ